MVTMGTGERSYQEPSASLTRSLPLLGSDVECSSYVLRHVNRFTKVRDAFRTGDVDTFRLLYLTNPILSNACGISRFSINHRHTFPDRIFSALSKIIPTLIPITSLSTQPLFGLKASMNP